MPKQHQNNTRQKQHGTQTPKRSHTAQLSQSPHKSQLPAGSTNVPQTVVPNTMTVATQVLLTPHCFTTTVQVPQTPELNNAGIATPPLSSSLNSPVQTPQQAQHPILQDVFLSQAESPSSSPLFQSASSASITSPQSTYDLDDITLPFTQLLFPLDDEPLPTVITPTVITPTILQPSTPPSPPRFIPTHAPISIGLMDQKCPFCEAYRFIDEKLNCCHNGKVSLPPLFCPDTLRNLYTQNDTESKTFRNNIRIYNNAFAFASMEADITPPPGRGPYCYKVHGQVYHRVGTLHPETNSSRRYAQLYIHH